MAVDIFICRTAARDTERCASSCFLVPPALCLPESPVTNLYIRCSRCSTMLHSLHHWSKMKHANSRMSLLNLPEQYFVLLNECKYGYSSEFRLYRSVCGLWCRPSGQIQDVKGLFREVETQLSLKQRVSLLQSNLCSVSAVIQVFVVKVGRTEDMRVCQMPIQEFESSKEEKKKNPFRCQKMFCSSSSFVEKAETVQSLQRRDGSGRSGDESTSPQRGREDR